MIKVLIITYYWPPSGGAGVQRWLKFSKYLPQFGWEPFILTVDPEYATYPVLDSSLERDIPESIKVFKTKATDWFRFYGSDKSKVPSGGFASNKDNSFKGKFLRFIRGNFFIPDPRRGWNRFAFKKACEIIDKENIKHIITTSPPHSTQLIGLKLKRRFPELKWICDFRDPWTDVYYYDKFYPTCIARSIDAGYEMKILINCDKIITVGPSLKRSISAKLQGSEDKTEIISNGYDEADFKNIIAEIPAIFTITYIGTLSEKYPVYGLMEALIRLIKSGLDIKLRFVGIVPEIVKNRILTAISRDSVEFIPYVQHNEAINYMMKSSMLLLVIPEHENNMNIVTGKIFEYIASGKPILCLGPEDGDAASLLSLYERGWCCSYSDVSSIESIIISAFNKPQGIQTVVKELSHRNIVKKLVSCIV